MREINNVYAALVLIEILYDKGLINKATFNNVKNKYKLTSENAA